MVHNKRACGLCTAYKAGASARAISKSTGRKYSSVCAHLNKYLLGIQRDFSQDERACIRRAETHAWPVEDIAADSSFSKEEVRALLDKAGVLEPMPKCSIKRKTWIAQKFTAEEEQLRKAFRSWPPDWVEDALQEALITCQRNGRVNFFHTTRYVLRSRRRSQKQEIDIDTIEV